MFKLATHESRWHTKRDSFGERQLVGSIRVNNLSSYMFMQLELDGRQRIKMSMSFHWSNRNSIIWADLDSA